MSQQTRTITRENVAFVYRFTVVALKNPDAYRTRTTEQLKEVKAALEEFDRNGDELVFEQPQMGDAISRFDDEELPSMIERGEIDQKLLGYRFFTNVLNPVLKLIDQIIGERELDELLQGIAN
jgi:hypothetical protein